MDHDPVPTSPLGAPRPLPPSDWRGLLARLLQERPRPLVLVGVVVSLVALVVVVPPAWSALAGPGGDPAPEATLPRAGESGTATITTGTASASPTPSPTAAPGAGPVVVHAAGAVVEPGVYELPPGARVDDLVLAAGGLAPDADADRVNLALPLVDGERVYVPALGEQVLPEAPAPSGGAGGAPNASGGAADGESAGAPVDVNTADLAALEALPGVGPVTAQAIIDHRTQQGPFTSVDDLLAVNGIGEAKLAQLRDHVVVGG